MVPSQKDLELVLSNRVIEVYCVMPGDGTGQPWDSLSRTALGFPLWSPGATTCQLLESELMEGMTNYPEIIMRNLTEKHWDYMKKE